MVDTYGLTYHFLSARNAINAAINDQRLDDLAGKSELYHLRDALDKATCNPALVPETIAAFKTTAIKYTERTSHERL